MSNAELRVEVRERLVQQKRARLAHDGPPERDPLALAAGQLRRLQMEQLLDLQRLGDRTDTPLDGRAIDAAHAQPEPEVVGDGLVWIQRVGLEHHRQIPLVGRDARHVASVDDDASARRRLEPGNQPEHRALAAAGRADEHQQLAVADLERQIAHRDTAVREDFGDALERNRHGAQPFIAPAVSPSTMRRSKATTTATTGSVVTTAAARICPQGT